MVRIAEQLIRKRAEHNECEIYSLEELSLHQLDIEKIEYVDKWCRDLKILYLQSNLIGKIENLGRLKKLEYLNMALNNIEIIENLEGCESLTKLDLTVNFVGQLTSVASLKDLIHLEELFLTGNPCSQYEGYKDFVLATLPRLKKLDGIDVSKSEKIRARQNFPFLLQTITEQEEEWKRKRISEQKDAEDRRQRRTKLMDSSGDGEIAEDDPFWKETTPYTPESRLETHEYMQEKRKRTEEKKPVEKKKEKNLFAPDGRAYNMNEGKLDYTMKDDTDENMLELVVRLPKHLDISLVDCDVQPTYVRVTVKGKILQLCMIEEVKPDASEATRSEVTGKLYVRMPKARDQIMVSEKQKQQQKCETKNGSSETHERLEVGEGVDRIRLDEICKGDASVTTPIRGPLTPALLKFRQMERDGNQQVKRTENFVDDPDVPPLV